jgi:hypothetical protein
MVKIVYKKEVKGIPFLAACHTLAAKEERTIHSDKFYPPLILLKAHGGYSMEEISN